MSARCDCRIDCPFPVACGCQVQSCPCFLAGQEPPLDLGLPAHLSRPDAARPVDLDEIDDARGGAA